MNFFPLKLITIIAEDELETALVSELRGAGATGYTISKARGAGSYRERTSEWEGENIRIEALVIDSVADEIAARLSRKYLNKYGVVFYRSSVEVLRGDKFNPA